MKTKHLILHNGRPYLADGEKPPFHTKEKYSVITKRDIALNETILKDWENSLEVPENVSKWEANTKYPCLMQLRGDWYWAFAPYFSTSSLIKFPQLVEVDGKTIIRLITK